MSKLRPFPVTSLPKATPGRLGKNAGGPKTTLDPNSAVLLFSPITFRGLTLKNRIGVSPMCQYSAQDGLPNAWHLSHLGSMASRGAGLILVEATGVSRTARITPNCLGLLSDAHVDAFKPIVEFIQSQGAAAGIQLAHAGRKASTLSPFFTDNSYSAVASQEVGGWPDEVVGPSPIKQAPTTANVVELDVEGIAQIVASFEKAAEMSLAAGFDVVEIHGAHGYLIHSFLSPLSNKRTDAYGGPLENRMRLALEVTRAVRAKWPETKPLFFRLSASDFVDGGLTIDESVIVCRELKALGVDVVDCSSMGIVPPTDASIPLQPGYNVPLAQKIRHESNVATAAVGLITEAAQAEAILQDGSADIVLLARAFLNDPSWVLNAAAKLGAEVEWPLQYRRGKPRM
ncbi:hypothetical protein CcCBS67573_g02552 [Chytriomyces confervae]|uniref:NADH:flavin oxidoreductase/NADH oxidase N-terminal domain-containing protein n=1 Tax=Chytriomyces confervae TaxID=246404 RepID=A0A507FKE4_9FUNG|nr:hypothetical protein CcCBS67573_g02552 [Chytriomyces confervae]